MLVIKRTTECVALINHLLNNYPNWSRRQIHEEVQKSFAVSRSAVDRAISEHPTTNRATPARGPVGRHTRRARHPERIIAVRNMIVSPQHAPGTHRPPREIARVIGTSHRTVRRIIDEDLDMRHFTRLAVHAMTDARKGRTCCPLHSVAETTWPHKRRRHDVV
jgi:hypothetical protein